ncbi:MAG: hypothetical protein ACTSPY_14520, partial [Candidatus Helarchaeota archaeon]
PNTWYHIRIDFECGSGGYNGLAENTAAIYINNTLINNNFILSHGGIDPKNINGFHIGLGYISPTMYKWIDAIDYSWATGYYIGRNLNSVYRSLDYLGLYSFTNEIGGSNPVGWIENESGIADFHIIEDENGHRNVYQLRSDLSTGNFSYTRNYFSNQSSGTIELWVMDDGQGQGNGNLYLGLMESEYRIGHIITDTGAFRWYYNDGTWHKIYLQNYEPNIWYHIRIDFECGLGGYNGLDENTAAVYINGVLINNNFTLSHGGINPRFVNGFHIGLGYITPITYKWVDAIDYSWSSGYYFGRNLYLSNDTTILTPINLVVNPNSWSNINSFDITWINPIEQSGIVGFYYKLDSAPNSNEDGIYISGNDISSYSGITVVSDGIHPIYVWLKDKSGNVDYEKCALSHIYLDTTSPFNFTIVSNIQIINNRNPSVICRFVVEGAGINVSSVQYAFSTNGSTAPINWMRVDGVYTNRECTISAVDGETGVFYAKINFVPFMQFSETDNTIRFRASDMAGNVGTQSEAVTIMTIRNYIIIIIIIITIGSIGATGTIVYYKAIRPSSGHRISVPKKSKSKSDGSNVKDRQWNIHTAESKVIPEIIKDRYSDIPFTVVDKSEDVYNIFYKVDQLPLSNEEKNTLKEELQVLSSDERNEILNKIYDPSEPIQKVNINELTEEFQILENEGKLEEALNILKIILEITEKQGYLIVFDKLLKKYNDLQQRLGKS